AMLQPLATLQHPTGALYRMHANTIALHGAPVDVGFSVDVTIDPVAQALTQRIAACYTGRQDVCQSLRLQRKEDAAQAIGHRMLEHGGVRMADVAIIGVEPGAVEALAGALSPCTQQANAGPRA